MTDTARIVVGYDGEDSGEDALVFGRRWSAATGDRLVVVTVHPGQHAVGPGRVDAEWAANERERADGLLERARSLVGAGVDAEYQRVDAASAAHGLHDLAETGGSLVVLGSRRRDELQRTYASHTAQRLMQGSALPVAIVPWGYADTAAETVAGSPFASVAIGFIDTPDGQVALTHAAAIAARLSARLRIISIVPDTRVRPSLGEPRRFAQSQRDDYQQSLDAAVDSVPAGVEASGELREGPVVEALTQLGPDDADVLVVGSRGYGPMLRVLLGGVSSRVVRHSRIPVVVVPRGSW